MQRASSDYNDILRQLPLYQVPPGNKLNRLVYSLSEMKYEPYLKI